MPAIICQSGLKRALANMFGPAAAAYPTTVHLFSNNHTPTVNDTIADYTELAAAWYASQAIAGWTPPIYAAPRASSTANANTWTNTGSVGADVTVYGYYVTDSSGALVWAERDPLAPVVILGGGGTYSVQATRTERNE